jgi:hypothetical protein
MAAGGTSYSMSHKIALMNSNRLNRMLAAVARAVAAVIVTIA